MLTSHRLLYSVGLALIGIATGQSIQKVFAGGGLLEATIDFTLISFAGVLFIVVGTWIPSANVDSAYYRRIVGWGLGGVTVMLIFLTLRALHPGVTTSFSFGTRALALSIGSLAGLAIGIYEAATRTREDELRDQKHELDERNAALERTRNSLEERNDELREIRTELISTIERLEASNERLDRFASTAAHDLNEPLRMVTRYLELLEDRHGDDLDEEAVEFLEFAVGGADRMRTMIDDLLSYARIDTRGNAFDVVDLAETFETVRTDLAIQIEATDATVTADSVPTVYGDPSQLRQLLQNLVSNGIEYSTESPRVHVSGTDGETICELRVEDDGIGIDPAEQDRIFELFERLHPEQAGDGSGLGLSICKRIVDRHGGTITVDSTPGEGTTVTVTLPANATAARRLGATPTQSAPSKASN